MARNFCHRPGTPTLGETGLTCSGQLSYTENCLNSIFEIINTTGLFDIVPVADYFNTV